MSLRSAPADVLTADRRSVFAVEIADDVVAIEAAWRDLQTRGAVSPYQRYDFIAPWLRHVAAAAGLRPRMGVVRDDHGDIVMIMPFAVGRRWGVKIAGYMGGSHANLNMPLVDPEAAPASDPAVVRRLLDDYCHLAGVDVVLLANQPESWAGRSHCFLAMPRQASPSGVRRVLFEDDFASFQNRQLSRDARSKLRRKAQRMTEEGGMRIERATTVEEMEALLFAYLAQKHTRLTAMGIPDPFAEPGVGAFLRDAAMAGLAGEGGLEFCGLYLDGLPVAINAGIRHRDQFSLLMASFDADHPLSRNSPGEVLLNASLAAARKAGVVSYDFGVGEERYKETWSNDLVALFDSFHAATAAGRIFELGVRARTALVRAVKRRPSIYGAFKAARAFKAQHGSR